MNGIIHNCSHNNNDDVHVRMTEDQIFTSIFNYIDFLFQKIKPRKLFFMALDGVAPRAKMNQQRARRFRSAKLAEEAVQQALARGEVLPSEPPFDSNCITPGTEFMAKLTAHLKYFVNKKVSEDVLWRNVRIVLSGHEVPGEGEHKIMEYIRLSKAHPSYEPNIRHCLYGLDADLIMLGLLSHEPNFALLREEVTFGRQPQKRKTDISQINFYLMHLCLVREYLEKDFLATLNSEFLLERLIDDFVLIAVFVGNDFLPNLPSLMINEGGFQHIFDAYKRTLKHTKGTYINEFGKVNLKNLQIMFNELCNFEMERFKETHEEMEWVEKRKNLDKRSNKREKGNKAKKNIVLTSAEKEFYENIKAFIFAKKQKSITLPIPNVPFVHLLTRELNLSFQAIEDNECVITKNFTVDEEGNQTFVDEETGETIVLFDDEESAEENLAFDRVFFRYDHATVTACSDSESPTHEPESEFVKFKSNYYKEKMNFTIQDKKDLDYLVYKYVEGIQWVMYYYYQGVRSWEWYFPFHYAPFITDIKGIEKLQFNFDLGKPFAAFEQLMGVLPAASRSLIPEAFRELMVNETSSILDFYPKDFKTDLNGKKNDWEAVVLIPFIDEKRLLKAMAPLLSKVPVNERKRNELGNTIQFVYDEFVNTVYPSSLPGKFPDIQNCKCKIEIYYLPTWDVNNSFVHVLERYQHINGRTLVLPGFPSINTLKHTSYLAPVQINVFSSDSRNESVVIKIQNLYEGKKIEDIVRILLTKPVYIDWPYLVEARIHSFVDPYFRYEIEGRNNRSIDVQKTPHSQKDQDYYQKFMDRCEEFSLKRRGISIGEVSILAIVRPFKQMVILDDGSLIKEFSSEKREVPIQLCVFDITGSEDPRYIEKPPLPIEEEYSLMSKCIFVGDDNYGSECRVLGVDPVRQYVHVSVEPLNKIEGLDASLIEKFESSLEYRSASLISKELGISRMVLSKITSGCHVFLTEKEDRINIGLNMKFETKGMKVLGYSRKSNFGWEFSRKAVELIKEYMKTFPELFRQLEENSNAEPFDDSMICPGDLPKLLEIRRWVREKTETLSTVPLDVMTISKELLNQVELLVDRSIKSAEKSPAVEMQIPKKFVLNPKTAYLRLKNQKASFQILDRVVYCLESGNVPLGARGTVIGITANMLDVLFDVPFLSGTSLAGRCSAYRGAVVESCCLLNITNRNAPTRPVKKEEPRQQKPSVSTANDVNGRSFAAATKSKDKKKEEYRKGKQQEKSEPNKPFDVPDLSSEMLPPPPQVTTDVKELTTGLLQILKLSGFYDSKLHAEGSQPGQPVQFQPGQPAQLQQGQGQFQQPFSQNHIPMMPPLPYGVDPVLPPPKEYNPGQDLLKLLQVNSRPSSAKDNSKQDLKPQESNRKSKSRPVSPLEDPSVIAVKSSSNDPVNSEKKDLKSEKNEGELIFFGNKDKKTDKKKDEKKEEKKDEKKDEKKSKKKKDNRSYAEDADSESKPEEKEKRKELPKVKSSSKDSINTFDKKESLRNNDKRSKKGKGTDNQPKDAESIMASLGVKPVQFVPSGKAFVPPQVLMRSASKEVKGEGK